MTEREATLIGLDAIAAQIKSWLEWNKAERDREPHLTTDDGTSIMALPVPYWPSRGQFRVWIEAIESAATMLRADAETMPRSET